MGLQLSDIEAAQQLQPLLMTQHNGIVRPTHGPLELVALQTFLPEHETGLVPVKHLELASLFIAEDKQSSVEGRSEERRVGKECGSRERPKGGDQDKTRRNEGRDVRDQQKKGTHILLSDRTV